MVPFLVVSTLEANMDLFLNNLQKGKKKYKHTNHKTNSDEHSMN